VQLWFVRFTTDKNNVHPYDEKLTLSRNTTKLRREGHDLRVEYVRFAVVISTTEECSGTPGVSRQKDVRYSFDDPDVFLLRFHSES